MSEAERIEMPEETLTGETPQEAEAAATFEITSPDAEAAPEEDGAQSGMAEEPAPPEEAEDEAGHGLSNATLESMSRTDSQAQAVAEAERTKWERRKAFVRDRVQAWCRQYMADGGFKLGIALVTAVIAAAIIVIAGIFSDRQLGVVFWRAVTGFFVSGIFMGGALYWLDRFGIPLFIAKHEDQIQMEWLAEAEEPEPEEEESVEEAGQDSDELEELMPQPEGEGTGLSERESAEAPLTDEENSGNPPEDDASAGGEIPEETEEAQSADDAVASGADIDGLENAVLDDAFSSPEAEEEPEEPPTFAPMTADNLESVSVPEGN